MAVKTRIDPITEAVHLSIDMQNIFSRGAVWETPWMERVLPVIVDIAARYAVRTVFSRFITPLHATDRPGRWRRYFERWRCATRAKLPLSELELVPALQRFAPPAQIIDKPATRRLPSRRWVRFCWKRASARWWLPGPKQMFA